MKIHWHIEINRPQLRVERRAVRLQALLLGLVLGLTALTSRLRADISCGGVNGPPPVPFNDAGDFGPFFCVRIAEAYFAGLTSGTTATTYSPAATVNRGQMAAFITSTLDQALKRGSRRAALGQFWTVSQEPSASFALFTSPVNMIKSDGTDVYIAHSGRNQVVRFAASGPQNPELDSISAYSGAENAAGIAITPNYVYVTGNTSPGRLYRFRRQRTAGSPVELLTSNLGAGPSGIAYDGERIWTANSIGNSVSIYNPTTTTTTTIAPSFSTPYGILYDGANIWVTNYGGGTLVKLDQNGTSILQTVTVGAGPVFPMFDGTNIWVPNSLDSTISVVRAATGQMLATLTGNGLTVPFDLAFDGQRVMVTNNSGDSLSLWKAADLTPLGAISVGFPAGGPSFICSDGQDFWVTLTNNGAGGSTVKKY